ncbi:cytochrome c oxidase assembly protein [Novosphingobium tardum]|uniref:Cytochrome c oxidase assembly protein n=1 Tax=Novosphingobium tardum TaxID=1538021 RepID=A0ABV8RSD2_9SPHN
MLQGQPYCGAAPLPPEIWLRWNLDPIVIAGILALCIFQVSRANSKATNRVVVGWLIAALAFVSPLCALSVALFSARVGQHMVLVLIAAPLIATGLAGPRGFGVLLAATVSFCLALWFWHMPAPYDASLHSTPIYWAMHATLLGSAIMLWAALRNATNAGTALAAGTAASMAMGLLGAVIALGNHPLYLWHLNTTWSWGLDPLTDQHLGGLIMWVPGSILFVVVAVTAFAGILRAERPLSAA